MANAVVNALPERELLLVQETAKPALAGLSEDDLVALHTRVQRARSKYVKNYRREASASVSAAGGRGKAHARNQLNRDRAEVFEDALARVSRALADAARASAAELKAERLAAAAAAKAGVAPTKGAAAGSARTPARAPRKPANAKSGDRSLVSPRSVAKRADSTAQGARRQAKRDSR